MGWLLQGEEISKYKKNIRNRLQHYFRRVNIPTQEVLNTKNLNDYLLSISQASTNDFVSYLSNFRNQLVLWKKDTEETIGLLDKMFSNYNREDSQSNQYEKKLKIKAKWFSDEIGYEVITIDTNNNFRKTITYEPYHEYFFAS